MTDHVCRFADNGVDIKKIIYFLNDYNVLIQSARTKYRFYCLFDAVFIRYASQCVLCQQWQRFFPEIQASVRFFLNRKA